MASSKQDEAYVGSSHEPSGSGGTSVSPEEAAHFHAHRGDLEAALQSRGSGGSGAALFADKSATGYVGLRNLGATCYMNSLLQV